MTSLENRNGQVNTQADPGSCQNARPQRHMLHERKKNAEGEWKVVRSYEVSTKLGKGGFAKVYLGKEVGTSRQYAIKVVDKSSLEKDSFKEKLNQEIRFQKSLNHENVVKYYSSFEDANNVYIVLEYCSNQTFKELLDRRKRLTEIEVKSHLLQLINSLAYIHSKGIIHRDLKIANIFLNDSMTLKLADFGLSASIRSPTQKRRTICGTPNYIAPEVLKNYGHDFSVDNWAVGVIVYTFLVGKPPYEEKEVENTLKNIKANNYAFPENLVISHEAKDFIQKTLVSDPQQRMTLEQMKQHAFLQSNQLIIPATMPASTLALPPTATFLKKLNKSNTESKDQQENNSKDSCNFDVQAFKRTNNFCIESIKTANKNSGSLSPKADHQDNDNYQLLRYRSQDNYFQSQIQESDNLQRRAEESSTPLRSHHHHPQNQQYTNFNPNEQEIYEQYPEEYSNPIDSDSKPMSLASRTASASALKRPPLLQRGMNQTPTHKSNIKCQSTHKHQKDELPEKDTFNKTTTLTIPQSSPIQTYRLITQNKNIYIFDYIDCCSKFGLAYYLSNGTVGILLNDSSVVQIVGNTFKHISKGSDGVSLKEQYQCGSIPEAIMHQYQLLLSIKDYFISKYKDLSPSEQPPSSDFEKSVYLKKYTATKKAQLFRFSNNDVHTVFVDKSEIIITSADKNLYFKDKSSSLRYYSLKDRTDLPTEILKRVNYIKDIFLSKTTKDNNQNTSPSSQLQKSPGNHPQIISASSSPINSINSTTQHMSQSIPVNQRIARISEHPGQAANSYSPFGHTMNNNKTNQNTTTSTNNSVSTQQNTPFEVATMAPKNTQFISKLNLGCSMKSRVSPDRIQLSNLKPTSSSLASSVHALKISH